MDMTALENKAFAFACLGRLRQADCLTEPVLALLTDPEACRRQFHCSSGFSVLLEVPAGCGEDELRRLCHTGAKRRYYQERFRVGAREFVVVNHWYGPGRAMPDNRTPFLAWVEALTGR